ncbi:hypothetical protein [Roseomonas chloroacetimidivorans]|uniref:hypothetical protein n=1 Tax=Roseomonas chloroacetimidivorans TaxID=1766656 RepID=UPI003C70B5BE
MSVATEIDTASGAGRKHAPRPQGFRVAPGVKVKAAATTAEADPIGSQQKVRALRASEAAAKSAATPEAILDLIERVSAFGVPGAPPWPGGAKAADRYSARYCRLLERLWAKLEKTPGRYPADIAARVLDLVLQDEGNRLCKTNQRLIARVRDEMSERAILPTTGADADLIATCERYINRSRWMNSERHPEAGKEFEEISEYPALREDERAIHEAKPQTVLGLAAIARVALYEAECARCNLSPPAWSENDELILAGKILRGLVGDAGFGTLDVPLPALTFRPIDGVDDHDLIERCDDFVRRKREAWTLEEPFFGKSEVVPAEIRSRIEALSADYHDRLDEIIGYTAGTPQGLRAKARAMEAHLLRNVDGSWPADCAAAGTLIDNILALVPDAPPAEHCMLADLIGEIDAGWDKNTGPLDTDESTAADITPHSFKGMLLQVGILLAEVQELYDRSPQDACTDAALNRARRLAWSLHDGLRARGGHLPDRIQEYYFPAQLDPFAHARNSQAQASDEAELLAMFRRCTPLQADAALRLLRSLKGGAHPLVADAEFHFHSADNGARLPVPVPGGSYFPEKTS